ncbi:MAG TPA: GGDEF domain-containing protein [Pseudolabrys sp.]|nr:GGDEF domain-containing protein [Pseudolabrys sp.]
MYSLPRWRLTRWLADAGPQVPRKIRVALIGGLFGTLPVFAAGVANTLVVSAAIAMRMPTAPFIAWLILEIFICSARLGVLIVARRAAVRECETPTDIYLVLGLAWSGSVGYGVFVSMTSGDWVIATLACVSAAAMVGGICFRHFSAPRLAAVMILTSLGPTLPGAALAGEPVLYVAFAQVPMYVLAMTLAAFKLNKMLIATMSAERENDYRARHDVLTGLPNREGFAEAIGSTLAVAQRKGEKCALLFLDLDDFKTINDTYGHAAGDRLLKMVAGRLVHTLRTADVATRIGGDEFLVLAKVHSSEQAVEIGQRLIAAVASSYDLGGAASVKVGVSVGIAMAPEYGSGFEDLLIVADAALYEAKSKGKSRCCVASLVPGRLAAGEPGDGIASGVGAAA